ncbi:tyrosine recombinase [Bacteroidia bacterium]|nr:tyrosine recombinase [Bacteroidia bacterium]
MKCDMNPKFWDVKAGKASGRTTEAMKTNSLIDNTKVAIYKVYRELQERDNYVTAEKVRNVFLGGEIKQQTLLELLDKHNRERKLLIGVSICQWNYGSYCRTRERLADFIRQWYNVSDIPVREIDHRFICDFEAYLTANYRPAHNTLTKYLKNLRHIIEIALEKNYISRNPFVNFRMQYQNPDRGFLTQDEVEKLIAFQFDNEKLEQARDVFVFCCFTGLSYSDVFYLTKENIQLSFGGKLWIKGRRQKTDTEYNIPLLNIPKMILEKYEKRQQGNQLLPVEYLQAYNGLLKQVAKVCGINKNMSSHLARHTFATTIALTKGVPIETVSKMLGHTSIKTTQIYAKVINSKISNDMDLLAEKLGSMETKYAMNI